MQHHVAIGKREGSLLETFEQWAQKEVYEPICVFAYVKLHRALKVPF